MLINTKPFGGAVSSGGGIGGNDANTTFLLQSNTTNGSTIFTDVSFNAFTVTGAGNAQHSTVQQKFGTSSVYVDGTGDYVSTGASATALDVLNDHTIDFWAYIESYAYGYFIGNVNHQSATLSSFRVYLNSNGTLDYRLYRANDTSTFITSANTAPLNQWFHVAAVHEGTAMALYVNGVQEATGTFSDVVQDAGERTVHIGAGNYGTGIWNSADSYLQGYMDEIRVSNIARWSGNFTPPTASYS